MADAAEVNVSHETSVAPAADAAPEQAGTATPVADVKEPENKQPETPKTFTQEELDDILSKRLAKEQRKFERDSARRIAEAVAHVAAKPAAELKPENFPTTDAYIDAVSDRKADEKLALRESQRESVNVDARWSEAEEAAMEKYGDYDVVVKNNPALPITPTMADVIKRSDMGGDVAYHLGTNPREAERIAKLSPFLQAKELGRIEAKLAANPPEIKKPSNAPEPIKPVKPMGDTSRVYDTTDPRSIKQMGTSEWIAADRLRRQKEMEARGHR